MLNVATGKSDFCCTDTGEYKGVCCFTRLASKIYALTHTYVFVYITLKTSVRLLQL